MEAQWLRYAGLGLAWLWAGWWVSFGLASGIGERLSPAGVALHAAVPGLLFVVPAVVAFWWPGLGGALLALEGLVVLVGYPLWARRRFPPATILSMLLTMALPPLVAGALLLAS